MLGESSACGTVRALLCGAAAVLLHIGVWQLAPSAPLRTLSAPRDESTLWLTVMSDVPAEQTGSTPAPEAVVTAPARAARHAARAPRTKSVALAPTRAASSSHGEQTASELLAASDAPAASSVGSGASPASASGRAVVRGPGLLAMPSACRGFFPSQARVDRGAVQISVHVDELGRARLDRLLMEMPRGHGFGSAAHACAAALRFAPAVDSQGMAVAGEAKLELTFSRS